MARIVGKCEEVECKITDEGIQIGEMVTDEQGNRFWKLNEATSIALIAVEKRRYGIITDNNGGK